MTAFAVPNNAFLKLPRRLQYFLFSPFGTRALRKLLSYHIAPGVITYSGKPNWGLCHTWGSRYSRLFL